MSRSKPYLLRSVCLTVRRLVMYLTLCFGGWIVGVRKIDACYYAAGS